jgi:hypothetical protein
MAFFLAGLNTNSNAHRLSRPLDHIWNKSAAGTLLEFELTVVFQLEYHQLDRHVLHQPQNRIILSEAQDPKFGAALPSSCEVT